MFRGSSLHTGFEGCATRAYACAGCAGSLQSHKSDQTLQGSVTKDCSTYEEEDTCETKDYSTCEEEDTCETKCDERLQPSVTKDSNSPRHASHASTSRITCPGHQVSPSSATPRPHAPAHSHTPVGSLLLVFGGALALVIADSQVILGVCIACLGLLEIPFNTLCVVSGLRIILRCAWCVSVCAHASSVMARRRRASSLLPVRTHARTRARRRQARTAARCSCTQQGKGARPSSQQ